MIRGIYAAATGMTFQLDQVNAIANNLANVETNGYKRSEYIPKAFGDLVVQMAGGNPPATITEGVENAGLAHFNTPGNLRPTGNPMNLALVGNGYFLVQRPDGQQLLTRDGDFGLNASSQLVTKTGDLVLSTQRQPITLNAPSSQVSIGNDGQVLLNNQIQGNIMVVQPTAAQLSAFPAAPPGLTAANPSTFSLRQGFLEASNVNVVNELVMLIEAQKIFNFSQKAVTNQNDMLTKATNDLGRVQ